MPYAAPCQTQPWLLEAGSHLLVDLAKCADHPAAPCSMVISLCLKVVSTQSSLSEICAFVSLRSHSLSSSCNSELWLLQLVQQALNVDEVEAGCCAGGRVLHSWTSDSMDSSSTSIGLVKDAADVDGITVVEANAVVG